MSATPGPSATTTPSLQPSRGMLAALKALRYAAAAANELNRDQWEFALSIRSLTMAGANETDLRRLIAGGMAEHRLGEHPPDPADLRLGPRSRFVLTPDADRLLEASLRPRWDRERRQLRYGGVLVKWFRQPAPSQETILSAFEDDGWPPRIDDPLTQAANADPCERLHDAVKRLNCGQRVLLFRRDGSGEGVSWAVRRGRQRVNGVTPISAVAAAI